MNIASLCRREVVAVPAVASLPQVAARMSEEHVGSVVIVSGDDPPRVTGILTDRDLALDVVGSGQSGSNLSAGDLARKSLVAVPGSASVQEATAAMEKAGVRRVLVVDEAGRVIGLVAAEDLMAAIADELAQLARALRGGIEREKKEHKPGSTPVGPRPVFPAFGTGVK
ncbi:CBS domain-containing protein [Variovorax sp. Sphag1AA]|uniref:CBS domain-containing protein n=1 Tax=Variovorax sp. Sphag1AA TaxID=2587027 RepID=UPI00161C1475|nr:CBS domain-containing protein [Variovorax sp. Sphag1AA]MBB3176825.1 CBS domain-containing protein [Variovorax sp. Sphag1AA]